jgi:hypothetical protein
MYLHTHLKAKSGPWNKGKLVGQKSPFKRKEIWAIQIRLLVCSQL